MYGWTDGRTRKSIIGYTPKSASNTVGRILLGVCVCVEGGVGGVVGSAWGRGRHHIREANDIFKEH